MGFCLNNNVAIGINALRQNGKCKRDTKFLIIDWDIHHGNGTQEIFYNDPNVVFVSIHEGIRQFVHDGIESTAYPSKGSEMHHVGGNEAMGTNINIPLDVYYNYNECGYGDEAYLRLMDKLILPVLREFNPDLIVISSGFDACIGDKMGNFRVTPICYGLMTRLIINASEKNKVALVLEGGYNLCTMPRAIGCCIYSCLQGEKLDNLTLNEYESEFMKSMEENERNVFNEWKLFQRNDISKLYEENCMKEVDKVIEKVKKMHSKYWKCLK